MLCRSQNTANPADSMNKAAGFADFGFLAPAADIDFNNVAFAAKIIAPDTVKNHFAGQCLARMAHELMPAVHILWRLKQWRVNDDTRDASRYPATNHQSAALGDGMSARRRYHSATEPSRRRQAGLRQRKPWSEAARTLSSSISMPSPGPVGTATSPS